MELLEIDAEWESYINANKNGSNDHQNKAECGKIVENNSDLILPKCEELYISTTTKVLYLNQEIDIADVFWKIPTIEYWKPESGVIKKQMKVVSHTKEEYNAYCNKLKPLKCQITNV